MNEENNQMTVKYSITHDDLRQVIDLIVPLEKNGDIYDGYCPFCPTSHEPHFIYNAEKMAWRCNDCAAHGNVIDLVQKYNKVSKQDAKEIIKKTVILLHKNSEQPTPTADTSPAKKDSIETDLVDETVEISEDDDISPSLIDEMTGMVMTLRNTKGYLGMVLSTDKRNICSRIPEGMNENIVSNALKFKDSVKDKIRETWNNYNLDPIEILLTDDEFKIYLFQTSIEKNSELNLCLFIDKDTTPSMFRLHIRNALMKFSTNES